MAKKEQENFICLDDVCQGVLEAVAHTPSVDGGACGDSYYYEYLQCKTCDSLYHRIDIGTWEAFSYEKEQKNIHPCDEIPDNVHWIKRP